jgi:hypothetical protein
MRRCRGPGANYLVIRRKLVLGYVEYLGPMYSMPSMCRADAERLYGKPGYYLEVVPWRKASSDAKKLAWANKE